MAKNTYTPKPTVANFNKDVRNNQIMKTFNDMKDKTRLEVTALFDLNTFPSSIPKMKK